MKYTIDEQLKNLGRDPAGFYDEKYKDQAAFYVESSFPKMMAISEEGLKHGIKHDSSVIFADEIKGLNKGHAIYRAKQGFPSDKVAQISPTKVDIINRLGKFSEELSNKASAKWISRIQEANKYPTSSSWEFKKEFHGAAGYVKNDKNQPVADLPSSGGGVGAELTDKFGRSPDSILQELTDEQLMALKNKDYSGFTDEQLIAIKNEKNKPAPIPQEPTFAEGVQDIVHGAIAGVAQGALDDKEFARLSSERSPKLYGTGHFLGEAAPLALAPSGIAGAALGVGLQSGLQSVIKGEGSQKMASNALEGMAVGGAIGAGGRLLGGAIEAAGEVSNWSRDALSKSYNISREMKAPLASREVGMNIRGKVLNNTNSLREFLDTKMKEVGENQRLRLSEIEGYINAVDPKEINRKINFLVENYRHRIKKLPESWISEFSKERPKAAKLLANIGELTQYKSRAAKEMSAVSENILDAYANKATSQKQLIPGMKEFRAPYPEGVDPSGKPYKWGDTIDPSAELEEGFKTLLSGHQGIVEAAKAEPLTINRLNDLRLELQNYLSYDKINSPILGKFELSSTKRIKGKQTEKIITDFEKDIRNLLYDLDSKVPQTKIKPLKQINDEYHNIAIMRDRMPNVVQMAASEDPSNLSKSLMNTENFYNKLYSMYPEKAAEILPKQQEFLALRDVFNAAEGVSGAPTSISRVANVTAYPAALRAAGYAGKTAAAFEEEAPRLFPFIKGAGKVLGTAGKYIAPPGRLIRNLGTDITRENMNSKQERSPDSVMNEMTMNNVLQEAQQGEIATGAKLPRNFAAARRNQAPIAQALGAIDPETAVRFQNAITNNDARTIENMLGSFATDPRYNGIFTPTPIISSKGAINSAVQSGNRIRIIDPIEQAIVRKDFLNDDALSNTEKAERINQLNKDNSINMPQY